MDTEITTLNTEINVRHYNIIHPDHSDSVIMNEVVLPSVTVLFNSVSVYCVCVYTVKIFKMFFFS